jgi:hypothetical protein
MKTLCWGFLPLVLALVSSWEFAAAESRAARGKSQVEEVELFAAMAAGELEVKVIPKDAAGGLVTIKNSSGRPLTIQLPEAFAAVPIAAQINPFIGGPGGLPFNGFNNVGGGNLGANQAVGGAFPGMFNGAGFPGGPMPGVGFPGVPGGGRPARGANPFLGRPGLFRVEPEKVAKLKIVSVCLEHGKADPHPRVAYELKPLDSYTENGATHEMVKMLARGQVDQRSAQAAAWNLENGLSWEELASKTAAVHLNGRREAFFKPSQIKLAKEVVAEAERRAASDSPDDSPSRYQAVTNR